MSMPVPRGVNPPIPPIPPIPNDMKPLRIIHTLLNAKKQCTRPFVETFYENAHKRCRWHAHGHVFA
jgi:hypothetical protein